MGEDRDVRYADSGAAGLSESAPAVSGVRDDAMLCPQCLENYEGLMERVEASDSLDYDRESMDPRAKTFVVPDKDVAGSVKAYLNGGEFEGRLEVRCEKHEKVFFSYEGTLHRYDDMVVPEHITDAYDADSE